MPQTKKIIMEYYIVMNEWNYPTESGREFIGDFDSVLDAEFASEQECLKELENFQDVCGNFYREGSGRNVDENLNPLGYDLNSSQHEEENHFFRSVIIKREVV